MLSARLPPHGTTALFTRLPRIGSSVARIHKSTRVSAAANACTTNLVPLRFFAMTKPRQEPADATGQHSAYKTVLTADTINPAVVNAEYAVRGELALRANALEAHLNKNGKGDLPFGDIVHCEIGNPQALDQKPLTFIRQVLALMEYPDLLSEEKLEITKQLFPKDAIDRAVLLKKYIKSVGAYSMSMGIPHIRDNVAKFISERDGAPAYPENIFLTAGASQGVNYLLQTIIASPKSGILIPIPQYPLYTATLALLKGAPVPYYLSEETNWSLHVPDLISALEKARSEGVTPRALVVINPGNPTGGCLQESIMEEVIHLCEKENLVLMADEVYQTNIYTHDRPFISFKKLVTKLNSPIELVSFHSVSKGMIGECGHRGGYFELHNFDPQVQQQIYKLASINLCPPILGQIVVDLMVDPPKPHHASYQSFQKEFTDIYEGLRSRALSLKDAFSKMQGVECQSPEGAMYLFPRLVDLPEKAREAAEKEGKKIDEYYCMRMLEAVGVCVIPGSGFGQKEGTWHYRTTFLASMDYHVADRMVKFHEAFMKEFS